MRGLLLGLIFPTMAKAFYFSNLIKTDQCVDFKAGGGKLRSDILRFSTSVPRPVKTPGDKYEFGCDGGNLEFCSVGELVHTTCPVINIQGRRIVWGLIKIPPFRYNLRSCRFGEVQGDRDGGDVRGNTEGAEIKFRIISVGMRRICELSSIRIQRNLVFFPDNYFVRVVDHHRSLNLKEVRQAVIQSINSNMATSIKSSLKSKYDCDTFFRAA